MTNVDEELGVIREFNMVPFAQVASGYKRFQNGDVIFAKITPCMENGNCAVVSGLSRNIGFGSTEFLVYRPKQCLGSSFLHYFLHNDLFRKNAVAFMKGSAGQKRLPGDYVETHVFPLPPFSEHQAIAAYLDAKTAQIDRKIDLLAQKAVKYRQLKQSLINQAVTRGLDKSAPTRDSGIAWIGQIPAYWEVSAITNIVTPVSIKNHPSEELLSVYRDYGVIIKSTRDDNHNRAGSNLADYKLVEPGFLVINKMKAWQGSLGISAFRGIVSPAYVTCKPTGRVVDPSYLHHLLRSQTFIDEYNRLSYGVRVDQWDMRYDEFKYIPVLLPPLDEQKLIGEYIESKTLHIDRLVNTINFQIDKLKELRRAMINDVVTGKLRIA